MRRIGRPTIRPAATEAIDTTTGKTTIPMIVSKPSYSVHIDQSEAAATNGIRMPAAAS